MKKNKANGLATFVARTPRDFTLQKHEGLTVTLQVQQSGLTEVRKVAPPTEELVNRLNEMGREYPFCVINRPGNHLIL